jgi:hypothetical protein
MDHVWTQLTRRSRAHSSKYFYSAQSLPGEPERDPEEAQQHALGQTLFVAFKAVVDNRRVTKIEEVRAKQQQYRQDAEALRRIASEIEAWVVNAGAYDRAHYDMVQIMADVQALRRVADWRIAEAARMRGDDDPLTIRYACGDDALAAGVQINTAEFLKARFGKPLHKLAAILCAVALGLTEIPSERVSRSDVFEGKERSKRRAAK